MVFVRQLQGHTSPVTMAVINQSNVRGIYNVRTCTCTYIYIYHCNYILCTRIYVCHIAYTLRTFFVYYTFKIPLCSHTQGNIVSCTKSQICLWTVNGTLLASTSILIPGSFNLLCCAVSEVHVLYIPDINHVLYMYVHVHVWSDCM